MKEHPIIFSAPMVRAILDGSKTQTRRIVKPQPVFGKSASHPDCWTLMTKSGLAFWNYDHCTRHSAVLADCPYGQPGDRLWVREAWQAQVEYNPLAPGDLPREWPPNYLADGNIWPAARKRAAMHMPRWASRITLEVTDVRVEQLQEIGEGDCIAEGWPKQIDAGADTGGNGGPFDWYRRLWDGLNEKRGHGWKTNPWVWVISFRRIGGKQ